MATTTLSLRGYDAPLVTSNALNFNNMNENCMKRDYDTFLYDLFKETHILPFIIAKVGGRHKTISMDFNWGEKEAPAVTATVVTLTTAGALEITADAEGLYNGIMVDDILYNTTAGTYYLVNAKGTTVTMTVNSINATTGALAASGGSSVTAGTAGDVLVKLGNVRQAGYVKNWQGRTSTDFLSYFRQVQNSYNSCTIIDDYVEIVKQVADEIWEFGPLTQRESQREDKVLEHVDYLAKMLWQSPPVVDANNNRKGGKGFFNFPGIQKQVASEATFGIPEWRNFIRLKVMAKNKKRNMTMFTNMQGTVYLEGLVSSQNQGIYYADQDKMNQDWGIVTSTLKSNLCKLEVIYDPILDTLYPNSSIFGIMDLDKVKIRTFGDDGWLHVEKDIHQRGDQIYRDQIYSCAGLQLANAGCHTSLELK